MKNTNFELIYNKIKEISGLKKQKDIADLLDISSSAIYDARQRGNIPDKWLVTIEKKLHVSILDMLPGKTLSEIAYRETQLPQNQPTRTQAEEYEYGYSIPPAEFKRMIAARFDSVFDWLADEFEGSSGALEVWMSDFMEKLRIDYPDYRQWLYEQAEKKRLLSTKENSIEKKHVS